MGCLLRLFELLRIPKEYEILCGLSSREHICQRHLAGLVHNQDIDCSGEVLLRPHPSSATHNVIIAGSGYSPQPSPARSPHGCGRRPLSTYN